MSGGPPWEPDDTERTVFRPSPGVHRSGDRSSRTERPEAGSSKPEPLLFGIINSPLLKAATPLLILLGRLSSMARRPDVADLRDRVEREVSAFEKRCRKAGISMELVRPAHYALCAAIDDVVLHAPWGNPGEWGLHPLTASHYRDAGNEEQFFGILLHLRQDPDKFLPVIELMYLCLSLGYLGQYRHAADGMGGFNRMRADICGLIIRHRDMSYRQRSPRWRGVAAIYPRRMGAFPVWVPPVAAVATTGLMLLWVLHDLSARSDALCHRISATLVFSNLA